MNIEEPLIPKHGGYRKLKSFQIAQLVFDVTARFCECYIDRRSRTHDQMVQAARSGVQNIAEGSMASGTSRKTELKLTGVARASLEEPHLDYEDYLRQRGLPRWPPEHPALGRFRARRCSTVAEVRAWAREEHQRTRTDMDGHAQTSKRELSGALIANAALSPLNLCCYLLDRQLTTQAEVFEREGGFTEPLYRTRQARRRGR